MALSNAPSASARRKPTTTPPQLTPAIKMIAVAPTVEPSENDMILPLNVINVIPTATQPMNDTVVSSDRTLGFDRKPGVTTANPRSATIASTRIADSAPRG